MKMIKASNHKNNNYGMTLTELMAAVCVLIILILIITAGIKAMYKRVESVNCSNNLKQIGMAIQLYTADNNYFLPSPGRLSGVTWARKLINGGYATPVKLKIFSCPSLVAERAYRINSGHNDGAGVWEHADDNEGGAMDISTIEKPGSTILLSEYQNQAMDTGIDSNGAEAYTDDTMWGGDYPSNPYAALLFVHNGGSNYLFTDLRVEWISNKDIKNDPENYILYKKP